MVKRKVINSSESQIEPTGGCPCLYVKPCFHNCSCARPMMSGGCYRCCNYGSLEQRKAAAERLATIIDSAMKLPSEFGATKERKRK